MFSSKFNTDFKSFYSCFTHYFCPDFFYFHFYSFPFCVWYYLLWPPRRQRDSPTWTGQAPLLLLHHKTPSNRRWHVSPLMWTHTHGALQVFSHLPTFSINKIFKSVAYICTPKLIPVIGKVNPAVWRMPQVSTLSDVQSRQWPTQKHGIASQDGNGRAWIK